MILIDLFSGYGGFHLGLQNGRLLLSKTYYSEKDRYAIANYRYNYPEAISLGPVEALSGYKFRDEEESIITFGSPCQDMSLAGKRAGLKGRHSSLIEYAFRLIRRRRPAVFIWENVKGAFSAGAGADFWSIIQAFAGIGGYVCQWQLVNTVWWLPQNRERIFLVGIRDDAHTTIEGVAGKRSGPEIFPVGAGDENADEARQQPGDGLFVNGLDNNYHKGADGKRTMISQDKQELLRWQNKMAGAVKSEFAPSLKSSGGTDIRKRPVIIQRPRGNNKGNEFNDCPTISSNSFEHRSGASANYQVVQINPSTKSGGKQIGTTIRRLTPTECERLQGLPDGWTKYGRLGDKVITLSDTQRYKLCGNGVSIPPVAAIAKNIHAALKPEIRS